MNNRALAQLERAVAQRAAIARLLRAARDEAGLSRRELAERAGVSLSAIASIEHGRRNPSVPCLERLLTALLRAG